MSRRRALAVLIATTIAAEACTLLAPLEEHGGPTGDGGVSGGDGASNDGASNDGGLGDGALVGDGGPSCFNGPFTKLALLPAPINGASIERGGHYNRDETELYFTANDVGSLDEVYVATRLADGGFSARRSAGTDINVPNASDSDPHVSDDGDELYFASTRGSASYGLYVAKRVPADGTFGSPTPLGALGSPGNARYPYLSPSDRQLYFATEDNAGGIKHYDLWSAPGPPFQTATPAAGDLLNTTFREIAPVISEDGLTLYFASTRTTAQFAADIFMARRTDKSARFETATQVPELSSTFEDIPSWLSRDGCRLLFSSNRTSQFGNVNIWAAERSPK